MKGGSTPTRYMPALDGLRGVAVLVVIIAHVSNPQSDPMGAVGVTIFFVLSGYLITTLLLHEQIQTGTICRGRFYSRRARRLLPALIFLLAVDLAARLARGEGVTPTLIAALYSSNFAVATGYEMSSLTHTWSLSLEEQFYTFWPLLVPLLLRRRVCSVMLWAAASSAILRVLLVKVVSWPFSYFGPLTRADAILIGCALAVAIQRGWRPARPKLLAVIGAIVVGGSCLAEGKMVATLLIFPAAIGTALVINSAVTSPRGKLSATLALLPLRLTGRISYGLYLWHPMAIAMCSRMGTSARLTTTLVASFSIATLSWIVIERPMLRHLRTDVELGRDAVKGGVGSRS